MFRPALTFVFSFCRFVANIPGTDISKGDLVKVSSCIASK